MNEVICCSACGLLMEDKASARQIFCPRCQSTVRKLPRNIESDLGLAIAALIVFFPVMIVLSISGYELALKAYQIKEVSQYTAWTPVFWPIKTVIFISFVLLVLQGLAEFIRRLNVLVKGVEL